MLVHKYGWKRIDDNVSSKTPNLSMYILFVCQLIKTNKKTTSPIILFDLLWWYRRKRIKRNGEGRVANIYCIYGEYKIRILLLPPRATIQYSGGRTEISYYHIIKVRNYHEAPSKAINDLKRLWRRKRDYLTRFIFCQKKTYCIQKVYSPYMRRWLRRVLLYQNCLSKIKYIFFVTDSTQKILPSLILKLQFCLIKHFSSWDCPFPVSYFVDF